MIATYTQQSPQDSLPMHFPQENGQQHSTPIDNLFNPLQPQQTSTSLVLTNRKATHHPKAGLNPLVDHAGMLFTVLSELKHAKSYRQLSKLQKELIQEINIFQEHVSHHNYNAEYLIVCRYILCATFDDIITNTVWGAQWDQYLLLAAYNQDIQHQSKFFTILERAIKDPVVYIDLMEFIYICLSLGYKGQFRSTDYSHYQLEQITHNLYKHIRAYRGSFSKALSPVPLKSLKSNAKASQQNNTSLFFVSIVTACIIMIIFISLDYLMDVISNEAYKNISPVQTTVSYKTAQQ